MNTNERFGAAVAVLATLLTPAPAGAQYSVLSPQDQVRLDALAREQARQDAEYHAQMRAAKEQLLRAAPLPAARNPLLGRWTIPQPANSGKKDELSQLLGLLGNVGRATCTVLFGEGITEFKPTTWSSIDSFGDDSLGPIHYRGDGKRIWAVPEGAQNVYFLTFEVVSADRLNMIMVEDCPMVRVGAPAPAGTTSRAPARDATPGPTRGAGPAAPPNRAAATPPTAPPPAPPVATRPSDEVCRSTFIDKLGAAGINQVRQVVDLRFRQSQQGPVPNSTLTRVEARGSACDDPRVSSVLYDFDTNGMLQAVTMVWTKASGAAAGTLFAERLKSLSIFHALPAPQAGRLEADTLLGRLTLLDAPQLNQVFETYAKK